MWQAHYYIHNVSHIPTFPIIVCALQYSYLAKSEWCIHASVHYAIIGSDNGLSRKAIIWTNVDISSIKQPSLRFKSKFKLFYCRQRICKCRSQTGVQMISASMYHLSDVIMSAMAYRITGMVFTTFCSGVDQRKHYSSTSLAFVKGILRSPANSPNKGPVTRKMFPFDDVIMYEFLVGDLWCGRVTMVPCIQLEHQIRYCAYFHSGIFFS